MLGAGRRPTLSVLTRKHVESHTSGAESLHQLVELVWLPAVLANWSDQDGPLVAELDHRLAFDREDAVLRLTAKPVSDSRPGLDPSQDSSFLESPRVKHLVRLPNESVRYPKKEQRVLVGREL